MAWLLRILPDPASTREPGSVGPPKIAIVSLAAVGERAQPLQRTAPSWRNTVQSSGRRRPADGNLAHVRAPGGSPKYLNNVVEADHGKLKLLIRPVRGFKTLKTAYATIKGFEVMRALRKSQAAAFNITRDICGEARIVERAFGLGDCALSEAVRFLGERLELEAA
jgi:hypothetical protein